MHSMYSIQYLHDKGEKAHTRNICTMHSTRATHIHTYTIETHYHIAFKYQLMRSV